VFGNLELIQFDWYAAAVRAQMLLSQTMSDEMLDEMVVPESVDGLDELLEVA
jgi:hypothetical protein